VSDTTTVILITEDVDDSKGSIASLNASWHDQREQFTQVNPGGFKYGDDIWACVFSHLDRERLLTAIRQHGWHGDVWVVIKQEHDRNYELVTVTAPQPGGTQPSPFVDAPPASVIETEPCLCGTTLTARWDPQYGHRVELLDLPPGVRR
jgi:hypothetical protein